MMRPHGELEQLADLLEHSVYGVLEASFPVCRSIEIVEMLLPSRDAPGDLFRGWFCDLMGLSVPGVAVARHIPAISADAWKLRREGPRHVEVFEAVSDAERPGHDPGQCRCHGLFVVTALSHCVLKVSDSQVEEANPLDQTTDERPIATAVNAFQHS